MRLSFAAAVFAILAVAAATVASLNSWKASNDLLTHTYQVREAADRVLLMGVNAETGERGFLLTGDEEYLEPYHAGRQELAPAIERLRDLVADNPPQRQRVDRAKEFFEKRMAILDEAIVQRRLGSLEAVQLTLARKQGKRLMDEARGVLAELVSTETELLQRRQEAWLTQQRRTLLVTLAGAAILLILAALAAVAVRDDLRRREEAERERQRIFEYQERLVSIVGHDLRNPLAAVLMTAKGLLTGDKPLTPELRKAMERVVRSANRMDALSSLLIDFTHARLGHGLPAVKAPSDARVSVERALDELRSAHPGRQLLLESTAQNSSGVWDSDRITQLVSNLASNALRYGAEGAPITVTLSDGPADTLEIRVHNLGKPIPAAQVPQLFEPYRRGDGAAETAQRGLGLGLYIVREIVRAHGGVVEVVSAEGEGTTFCARLPRHGQAAAAEEAAAQDLPPSGDAQATTVRRMATRTS